MSNINDSYFDGYYKDIWRNIIPDILTQREIDFILSYFQLNKQSHVLDLMCGYGRHAIGLAQHGIRVTAIDNLPDYTREIETIVKEKQLPVEVITGSALDLENIIREKEFDLVICMGNSLNFFNPAELEKLIAQVSTLLKTGSNFLVNSWTIAEIAIPKFTGSLEQSLGGFQFKTESVLHTNPRRIESVTTMTPTDGAAETKKAVDYIYSIPELTEIFQRAGLTLVEVFSIPGKKKFTEGEPRAYLVAKKS